MNLLERKKSYNKSIRWNGRNHIETTSRIIHEHNRIQRK